MSPSQLRARPAQALPSATRAPKQRRAQVVLDRLVAAASGLLRDKEFEAISVAEITTRAGLSVGAFYTKFTSKEHLLVHLTRDVVAATLADTERLLSERACASMTLHQLAAAYFSRAADTFARNRGLLKPVSIIVRQTEHRELRDIIGRFNDITHQTFCERVLAHRAEIRHRDPAAAVRFAILANSAALREIILYGEPVSRLTREHRAAAAEAARSFVAYLVWSPR